MAIGPATPRGGARQQAQAHGRAMSLEAGRLIEQDLKPITQPLTAAFDHARLPIDLPTVAELQADLKSPRVQVSRRAEGLLDTLETEGKLASSYPMPIQAWRFGDQLTMVFYNQPGRWSSSTEQIVVGRVKEIVKESGWVFPPIPSRAASII